MGQSVLKPVYMGHNKERVQKNLDLWKKGKTRATSEGLSMSEWILNLILKAVTNQ